jgi:chaperone modulatory protein CbpM
MSSTPKQTLSGLVLNEDCLFTLAEISYACSVKTEYIIELVDEGIVEPRQQQLEQQQWTFTGNSLLRARKALRLQQDLGINIAGAAVVLDMLDEIEHLRAQLRRMA